MDHPHHHHHHMHHGMDHSAMDHSHHGHNMGFCTMNMLWNSDTTNLCIIHEKWRITGNTSLVLSLFAIVLIFMGSQLLKQAIVSFEHHAKKELTGLGKKDQDKEGTCRKHAVAAKARIVRRNKVIMCALSTAKLLYSMVEMAIYMTFNERVILACLVGHFIGKWMFDSDESSSAADSDGCH